MDGWPREEQFRPTAAGRRSSSDLIFMAGLGSVTLHQTRSDSDIVARALTQARAKRVPSEEFRALSDAGESVAALNVANLRFGACRRVRRVLTSMNSV